MSVALGAADPLSRCNTDSLGVLPMSDKAAQPLSDKMVKAIQAKDMDPGIADPGPHVQGRGRARSLEAEPVGSFALLKTYPICRWSGELGPKIKEGDRQAPEGFYNITPGADESESSYYLVVQHSASRTPTTAPRPHRRPLMVHGDCSSRGCYAMTDEQIAEIYALGRDAFFGGQNTFQVQAYPFRMTAQNMARHRNNPNIAFWKMLKEGYDHFEVTHLEPKVDVCEKRYVFDAPSPNGQAATDFQPGRQVPGLPGAGRHREPVQEKERATTAVAS